MDATIQTSETTYSIENSNYKDITYSGNENFYGTGNDLNNLITASIGDDKIFGGLGNDTLIGNDGDDEIYGEGGADRIFGGAGDDILSGGQGNDVITDLVGINNISGGDGDDIIYVSFNEDISRNIQIPIFQNNFDEQENKNQPDLEPTRHLGHAIDETTTENNTLIFTSNEGEHLHVVVSKPNGYRLDLFDTQIQATTWKYNGTQLIGANGDNYLRFEGVGEQDNFTSLEEISVVVDGVEYFGPVSNRFEIEETAPQPFLEITELNIVHIDGKNYWKFSGTVDDYSKIDEVVITYRIINEISNYNLSKRISKTEIDNDGSFSVLHEIPSSISDGSADVTLVRYFDTDGNMVDFSREELGSSK